MTDADQIDRQLDERHRKAADHSQDSSIHNEARGAQIVQTNSLTTPAFLMIGFGLAFCIGISSVALFIAQQAKTEARVALNHAEEGRIKNEVNAALIQAYLPKKDKE